MSGRPSTRHLSEIAIGSLTGLAVAACFIAPSRPDKTGDGGTQDGNGQDGRGPEDAMVDGPATPGSDSGTNTQCTFETFSSAPAALCPSWMLPAANNGVIGQNNGVLYLNLNSGSAAANVECYTAPQTISSMTVEVKAPYQSSSTNAETFVGYMTDANQQVGVRFVFTGMQAFHPTCPGQSVGSPVTWDSTAHKFVRITRGTMTAIGMSPTATGSFTPILTCASPPAPIHAHLRASRTLSGNFDGGGSAQFESIEVCP